MASQQSSWELSLNRAKQELRKNQQQQHIYKDPRGNISSKVSNLTQNISEVRIGVPSNYQEYHSEKTTFDSCDVSGIHTGVEHQENGLGQYKSCSASNRGMQRDSQKQSVLKPSSSLIDAASTSDISAIISRTCLKAGLREIMARHLDLDIDIQDERESLPSPKVHTRTFSASSRPSLTSSFASASSTGIKTPVLDHHQFEHLSWDKFLLPTQPSSMADIFDEQKLSVMTSRDAFALRKSLGHEELEFIPSAILKGESRLPSPEMTRKAAEFGIDINPKYKGELTNFNLRNAMCLDDQNCSVRIHNIPPEASYSEIFAIVTHGRVFSFNYTPPIKGVFSHAAVDLAFLTREAADNFYHDARFRGGLYIRGQRIRVLWNRVKVLPAEGQYEKRSRVVRIKGPAKDFSVETLVEFFKSKFEFNLIASKEWIQWDGNKVVELAFSSIRSQSESAMKSFKLYVDQNMPNAGYYIWYAPDPCATHNDESKYRFYGSCR
ncbi:hypothetical protein EYC80_010362 [Monilinia laxa]|uniref:RRM domain-containing protein n=1 Tax=Monilinia laxa TaxID=61186 RepID=A0A5N6JNJ1_MONLA|nr:hypothetical protein EYC80_010362 [Monilinia laxa]